LLPVKKRLQSIQKYQDALIEQVEHEYPLSSEARSELDDLKEILKLRDQDIQDVQDRIFANAKQKVELRDRQLRRYEYEFYNALHNEYPLTEQTKIRLNSLKSTLGFTSNQVEIADIENRLIDQHEKSVLVSIERYEQELIRLLEAGHGELDSTANECLENLRFSLGISNERVAPVRLRVVSSFQDLYKANLEQYRQAIVRATEQDYPLTSQAIQEIESLEKNLKIRLADAEAIKLELFSRKEQVYASDLARYRDAFERALQLGCPLNQDALNELKYLKGLLKLRQIDTDRVESGLTAQYQEAYERGLKEYAQSFSQLLANERLGSSAQRDSLDRLRQSLKLKIEDIEELEARLTAQHQDSYQSSLATYEDLFASAISKGLPIG
jgi:hypothetical protein